MISIIIPTLNEKKVIAQTLDHLKPLVEAGMAELIVSDGKSTDGTIDIARAHGADVVVYEGTTRQRISMARNLGATRAHGDFYLFFDADVTVPEPVEFFKKALAHFERDPKLVGVTVFLRVEKVGETFLDWLIFSMANYFYIFQNNVFHFGSAPGEFQLLRAEAFKKVGGYDEKLSVADDMDMFMRLAKVGHTRIIPTLVVYHTGRRGHTIGWPRLLMLWWSNFFSLVLFHKSVTSEWKEIR